MGGPGGQSTGCSSSFYLLFLDDNLFDKEFV